MGNSNDTERITIGYLVPFIWGDLSLSLIKGIYEKTAQLDTNLVCIVGQRLNDTSREFTKQANIAYNLIDKNYIQGLIVWGSQLTKGILEDDIKNFYNKLKTVPVVGISTPIEDCCNITNDNAKGIETVMEHLIVDHGYTKIGFICANQDDENSTMRLNAYKESLKHFGLKYRAELVSDYYDFSIDAGKKGTLQLLEKRGLQPKIDIEAIVTPGDIVAVGVCEELRRLGINCPEEIAVTGFNNRTEAKICNPTLTSIDPSFRQQGNKAVELLVDIIKNNIHSEDTNVSGRLIIRNSCGCTELNLNELKVDSLNSSFQITQEQTKQTIENIRRKVKSFYYTIDSSWVENMVSGFIYDMENENTERFLSVLDIYLDIIFSHDEDVSNFQNIITLIRNEISPLIIDYKDLLKASDIWNKARIKITQITELVSFNKIVKDNENLFSIYSTEQRLMSTFALKEFLDVIELIVKDINISSCYIAIYDKQEDLLKKAKLIFGYSEKERIRIAGDYYFNPKEIVPKELRPSDRRYTFILNALYYKDIHLGFAVYETEQMNSFTFDTLSSQISSTIYRIKIFEKLKASEDEREDLFKKLEQENLQLEQKIEERTADINNVNKELQNAIVKANSASDLKSKFLADISHEIRTPLNCIIGFSEILGSMEYSSQEHVRYISLISQEADKLLKLLNEILDISKIEAGKMTLNREVFDIHNCIDNITSTYSVMAESKGLYYHVYGLDILPRLFIGDSIRLRQILVNILGNAIKFTNKGGITVSLEIAEERSDKLEILFNINDTGIGIASERQQSIFENFTQAEENTTSKYGGTGLGLPISKQLVEMMEGTIGVDSIEGEGSTFWFTVLFENVQPQYIEELEEHYKNDNKIDVSTESLKNSVVMLVEDYPVNRELAKIHLSKIGCKIIEANSGKKAIEISMDNDIDLILMDIKMSEMDGCEATKIIRATEKGKNIPILGMTANALEADIKKYIDIGMNDVIVKPLKKDDFKYKIMLWLSKSKNMNSSKRNKNTLNLEFNPEEEQFIDIERNMRELDGDIKFFESITTELLDNAKSQIPIIVQATKDKDYETLVQQAHSIRGGALNLSATPLANTAKIIEEKGLYNDLTDIEMAIKNLEMAIVKTEAYLKTKLN